MSKTKVIVAIIAIASLSSVAAADGYEGSGGKGYTPPAQVNWSGLYIGGHAGYGWADTSSSLDFGHFNELLFDYVGLQNGFSQDLNGWMGGVHLGLQWQRGSWVIGVEGTYDKMNNDGSSNAGWGFYDISCPFGCFGLAGEGTQSVQTEIDDLFTVSARLGHAWGRMMPYVKVGYARAEVDTSSNFAGAFVGCLFFCSPPIPASVSGSSSEDHHGYVLGAGLEYMVHDGVTLGFEYDYIKLESKTHTMNGDVMLCCGIDFPASHKANIDPDAMHSVNARLTFLFGPN